MNEIRPSHKVELNPIAQVKLELSNSNKNKKSDDFLYKSLDFSQNI